MSDLALVWNAPAAAYDLATIANDLATDDGLRPAILLSLFLDRQAEPGDELPEGETDRRGWWADAFPTAAGDKIGSRLWLLARAKRTPDTLARAQQYALESLTWLIEDSITTKLDVTAEFITRPAGLAIIVALTRPGAHEITRFRFDHVWASEAARI